MARTKCIVHDSVCVRDMTTSEKYVEVAKQNMRFGVLTPAILLYEFHESEYSPESYNDGLQNELVVDRSGTIENMNRLKSEYGFNTISIPIDDLYYIHYDYNKDTWLVERRVLMDAFIHSDWIIILIKESF